MPNELISTLRNLGPKTEEAFRRAGITTAEEVRALGADAAYQCLIKAGTRPHFIGYYAMVMGLQGRPWNDLDAHEKTRLRARFDKIVAQAAPHRPTQIEAALDALGVVAQRTVKPG